jgi:hypothetical protein
MWKSLHPKDRRQYFIQAEAEKVSLIRSIDRSKIKDTGKKRRGPSSRVKKNPDLPRRPRSAYMCFVKKNREKVKADFPEIGFAEIGQKLGELWRELPDAVRSRYQVESNIDKARYADEMRNYSLNGPPLEPSSDCDASSRDTYGSSRDMLVNSNDSISSTGSSHNRHKLTQSMPALSSGTSASTFGFAGRGSSRDALSMSTMADIGGGGRRFPEGEGIGAHGREALDESTASMSALIASLKQHDTL